MRKELYPYYLGSTRKIYCGFTTNSEIAAHCASGGIVTSVYTWLLQEGIVAGCLIYTLGCDKEQFKVSHTIATTPDQLIQAGGSIYMDFPAISHNVVEDIRRFEGKVAIVGLPCSISALKKLCSNDKELNEKIHFTMGLFCGHTSKRSLIETVLEEKNISIEEITKFSFRKGLWRGNSEVLLNNNEKITFPSTHFTTYQNLFIDSAHKCLRCHDHYAEDADLSTGDIWESAYKNHNRKHSIFVTRSEQADNIIGRMVQEKWLDLTEADENLLFQANKRAAIFHKAIKARSQVGRLFGYTIKAPADAPAPRVNELAAALLVFPFIKLSDSNYRRILFRVPRKILYGILVVFKLLTNF